MKTQKKLWSALAALCVATGTVAQPAYNYSKLQKEQLGRGVVAIRENPSDVVVGVVALPVFRSDQYFFQCI